MNDGNRENFIRIIEKEKLIDEVFYNIERISPDGGNGYFSLVFKADIKGEKRKAALKFFDPSKQFMKDRVERFKREAEFLITLENEPYVINAIGKGVKVLEKQLIDQGTGISLPLQLHFFSTELADGNIEELVYSGHLGPLELLYLFRKTVKSVFRLHNFGVCHRDLKPDNFLIFGNKVVINDLGTAKILESPRVEDNEKYIHPVGHRDYLAPELHFNLGIADNYAFSADIFSLGAILFEFFTKSVFTNYFYTNDFLRDIDFSQQILGRMSASKRLETYLMISKDFSKNFKIPDFYSFNGIVPNCIKYHLNNLLKSLVEIDLQKRNTKQSSIYRKIDICIKILENEKKYTAWLNEKKKRRLIREKRRRLIERKVQNDNQ